LPGLYGLPDYAMHVWANQTSTGSYQFSISICQSISENTKRSPGINRRNVRRQCRSERPKQSIQRRVGGRVAWSLKVCYGTPPGPQLRTCRYGESWSRCFRREVWRVLERSKNGRVCLWGSRKVAASVKGWQCVELALVREPYWVQGIFRTLHILSNMDPPVWNSCRPPVLNVVEGRRVSMGDWGNESYGNLEGGSLQRSCVEDIIR